MNITSHLPSRGSSNGSVPTDDGSRREPVADAEQTRAMRARGDIVASFATTSVATAKPAKGSHVTSLQPSAKQATPKQVPRDVYLQNTGCGYSGSSFMFDHERDQPFAEIHFGMSAIGDISWVRNEASPVITFEPTEDGEVHRYSVDELLRAITDATRTLGPRETPEPEPEPSAD